MTPPVRLGVLTPSSNTALEPLTSALAAAVPGCSAHFSRFKVTEIALSDRGAGPVRRQQDPGRGRTAGRRPGRRHRLERHRRRLAGLRQPTGAWCERITERTGIPATTAVLALNELLALRGITRLALVTPYTADVQQRIVDNYRAIGIEVVAERHLGISVNHDFALVEPDAAAGADARGGRGRSPQAITTFCTNLRAAPLAERVEAELDIPLLDTVSTTVWGQLRAAGADPAQVRGWGRLFGWQ